MNWLGPVEIVEIVLLAGVALYFTFKREPELIIDHYDTMREPRHDPSSPPHFYFLPMKRNMTNTNTEQSGGKKRRTRKRRR